MFLINPYIYSSSVSTDFIMTVDTTLSGVTTDFNLRIYTTGTVPLDGVVDWGDGSTDNCTSFGATGITHSYSSGGVYTITISGQFGGFNYSAGTPEKITDIQQWGNSNQYEQINLSSATNMVITATDTPNTSLMTSVAGAFAFCSSLTTIPNFNTWDMSNVTSALQFLYNATSITTFDMSGMDWSSCTNFGSGGTNGFTRSLGSCTSFDVTNMILNSSSNISMYRMFRDIADDVIVGLDTWNIEKVNVFTDFLLGAKVSTTEYDKLLISWAGQNAVDSLAVNFGTSQYTLGGSAASARADLISTDLWTITDGGGI